MITDCHKVVSSAVFMKLLDLRGRHHAELAAQRILIFHLLFV